MQCGLAELDTGRQWDRPARSQYFLGFVWLELQCLIWVLEGSLAGFFGCILEVWPAPGARESPRTCGGRSPPYF